MIRVLIDTGVWMSYLGLKRDKEPDRIKKAQCILDFLNSHSNQFEVCYSERNERELQEYGSIEILKKYTKLPSHILNQNWEETEETWDNIKTPFGDKEEIQFGEHIQDILPDKNSKLNRNDRGIYGDAVLEKCTVIIHENPNDFKKLISDAKKRGITLLDLTKEDCCESIKVLGKILKNV